MTWSSLTLRGLLIVLSGPAVAAASEADSLSLPMAGVLKREASVWSDGRRCDGFLTDASPYAKLPEGSQVVAYEITRECYRIAPPGGSVQAWVNRELLRLDPSLPIETAYISSLELPFAEYLKDTTPTGCAVVVEQGSMDKEGQIFATSVSAGDRYKVYRRTDERVQIGYLLHTYAYGWLPASAVEVAELFPSAESPCVRPLEQGLRYRFTADNAYYSGPSSRLEIVGFFKAGDVVTATEEFPNGWLKTYSGWFSPRHGVLDQFPILGRTTAARLRLRAAPSTEAAILYTFGEPGSQVVAYSRSGEWYRVTPDGFTPAGWVSASYLALSPGRVDSRAASYYLQALAPPQRPPQPAPRRPSYLRTSFDGFGRYLLLIAGIAVVLALLTYKGLQEVFSASEDLAVRLAWVVAVVVAACLLVLALVRDPYALRWPWIGLAVAGIPPALFGIYMTFTYLHYLFIRHPLEREIRRAVTTARGMDPKRLKQGAGALYQSLPHQRFKLANRRRRAEELRRLLETERELFEALLGRERMHAILRRLGHT